MRLHSNIIRASDVRDALVAEKRAGRVSMAVGFKELVEHGSRSHDHAVEVQLTAFAKEDGDGRRVGNSGAYGAMSGEYSATYSEWGWLMSALYRLDPMAVWGSAKHPVYDGVLDFDRKTAQTYNLGLLSVLEEDGDPYPYVAPRALVGREGAGRYAQPVTAWGSDYTRYAPRTPDWYRSFARLERPTA